MLWNSIYVMKINKMSILDNIGTTSIFSLSLVIERQVVSFSLFSLEQKNVPPTFQLDLAQSQKYIVK